VRFNDSQLRHCCESNLEASGTPRDAAHQVVALQAVQKTSLILEGAHSSRVHETTDVLLVCELRPELCRWYQRENGDRNAAAVSFRKRLNPSPGKRLEAVAHIPLNPF